MRLTIFVMLSSLLTGSVSFADTQYFCKGTCQKLGTIWNDTFLGSAVGPTKEDAFVALAKFCQDTVGPKGERYGLSTLTSGGYSYGPDEACKPFQKQN